MNNTQEWNYEGMLPDLYQIGELREKTIFSPKLYTQRYVQPVDYLSSVEPYVSHALISTKNFSEIKNLGHCFTGGITSFFGFESRLSSTNTRSDYLFAVSSKQGERETLLNLFQQRNLSSSFLNKPEWQQVGKFAAAWADPDSILYNKVLGLWLEFDTAGKPTDAPIPSIFIHSVPLRIDTSEDEEKCRWLTQTAIPLLIGQSLSEKLENNIINSLQHLPKEAVLFNIGVMLSRKATGVRLVIIRMKPSQIIPYLESLGWADQNNELSTLVDELKQYSDRIVLHIGITEDGLDPKIGFECSFSEDQYNLETRWSDFFDYLIKKNACLSEKKAQILGFMGVDQEDQTNDFNLKTYVPSIKISGNDFSRALVRYISHIKVSYKPNHQMEAKAYPGVRLFGKTSPSIYE
jgi:hypothetical protein